MSRFDRERDKPGEAESVSPRWSTAFIAQEDRLLQIVADQDRCIMPSEA